MTNEELKEALLNKRPVILSLNDTDISCCYISAIKYREKNGRIKVSAEVLDKNGRCLYNCDPKQIRYGV